MLVLGTKRFTVGNQKTWPNGQSLMYVAPIPLPREPTRPKLYTGTGLSICVPPRMGHGTAFIGPDLDTYFFCYHNLQDNKARRLLNFERIAWSGDKLIMTGPTDWEQEPPLVAQCDYFEREETGQDWIISDNAWGISDYGVLSQTQCDGVHTALFNPCSFDDYTAEFTLRLTDADKGEAGAVFSYADAGNYGEAVVNVAEMTFNISCYADNRKIFEKVCPLPVDFRPDTWHSVRIEKHGRNLRAFIDGMRKCVAQVDLKHGCIGYTTRNGAADFSYIAGSPFVDGNGILEVSLPVPGIVDAALSANQNASSYKINVKANSIYNLGIRYQSAGARINIVADGETIAGDIFLPDTKGCSSVITIKDLPLNGGLHEISFETTAGTADFKQFTFKPAVLNPRILNDDFNNGISELWGYREGEWTVTDGILESTGKYGKMLIGGFEDIHLTDYTAECDIIYVDGDMNGGLLFRATNPSTGGADDNPVLGTDFLQGYILMADGNSLTLGKHNFGWQPLVSVPVEVDPAVPHHLKVETAGATFKCYLDDMDTPLIVYTDADPFITGRAGLRCHNSKIRFDNFALTPAE